MTQGTPVIGSNAGGTSELLDFGNAGLLFETKNEIDLAEKMKLALEKRIPFELTAFQNSISKFNSNEVCEKVEKMLKSRNSNV